MHLKICLSRLAISMVMFFLFCFSVVAQSIDHESLIQEISRLNDKNQNEKSIIKLENIINDAKSTAYDKYQAYLLKSITYKNLYNYSGAQSNLDLAHQASLQSPHRIETEIRIQIEQLFIYFDLKQHEDFEELLEKVERDNLKYLPKETYAFFECILGHVEMAKNNYHAANQSFDKAIELLKNENPKHLPVVYKAKIKLLNLMGKKKEAHEAFEIGMDYAEKFKIDIYKISMLESMIYYYIDNEDYKNAYLKQSEVTEERKKYDAANRSGKLTALEKELVQQRSDLALNNKNRMEVLYGCIIVLLFLLSFILYKLYRSNIHRRLLLEKEMELMRLKLESFVEPSKQQKSPVLEVNMDNFNLTQRHKEIIELIRQGKTNKEIGNILFISENTVKYHLKTIYEILEIDSRMALINQN